MTLKRGENVGDHKVLYIRSTADEEFDAFEQLGPLMRRVLCEGPIKSSSIAILDQIKAKNAQIEMVNEQLAAANRPPRPLLDPQDPQLDMYLANGFLQMNLQNLMKDRSEADAKLGITPFNPKISVNTIRERRRGAHVRF